MEKIIKVQMPPMVPLWESLLLLQAEVVEVVLVVRVEGFTIVVSVVLV